MNLHTIYLAGGCYWGVEKYMQHIPGVAETEVGFANGSTHHPTYQQVRYENTGHAETVRVVYDADTVPLDKLLRLFFRIIDPVSVDQQGEDAGHQYRTGVYWRDAEDAPVVEAELRKLRQTVAQTLAVEAQGVALAGIAGDQHGVQTVLRQLSRDFCNMVHRKYNSF